MTHQLRLERVEPPGEPAECELPAPVGRARGARESLGAPDALLARARADGYPAGSSLSVDRNNAGAIELYEPTASPV